MKSLESTRRKYALPLTLACVVLCVGLHGGTASAQQAKGKPKPEPAPAEAAEPAEPDPVADAWRQFHAKRQLRHPARADDASQRASSRIAQLSVPAAPPTPAQPATPGRAAQPPVPASSARATSGWLGGGADRFAYVRNSQAAAQRRGVLVLLDERARVPGQTAVAASLYTALTDELTLHGWEVWTLALPEVGSANGPRRARTRFIAPIVDPDAEAAEAAAAETAAAAAAAEGKALPAAPAKVARTRRPWVQASPAARPGNGAIGAVLVDAAWAQWRGSAERRLTSIVNAIQAGRTTDPVPLVILGNGLGATLVAQRAQAEGVAALVLLDPTIAPTGLALDLDAAVAGLQAPTLVLNWQRADAIHPGVWLRTADETRVDARGAPAAQVARRVRGWLSRSLPN